MSVLLDTPAPAPAPQVLPAGESEHTLTLPDGSQRFYRAWLPAQPTDRALLLFHRGHEHSGRWQATVEALALEGVAVFAWDQRGHGLSSGVRGTAPSFATVVNDADVWVRHLVEKFGIDVSQTIALGHSLGGLVAAAWVHDYAPPLRGLVLATPAFQIKLYIPFALPLLRLREAFFGPGQVKSFLRAGMLTHDPDQAEAYNRDPLIFPQIAVNMLLDVHHAAKRVLDDAAAINVPLMVLAAGSDWVVREAPQRRFVERAGSSVKRFEVLPGFAHAVFHERDRHVIEGKVRDFIAECFKSPSPPASPRNAEREDFTHAAYDRLRKPSGLHFKLVRGMMKGPGRLSQGLRLGWRHGFDSGVMLDYIYQNQPQGLTPIGRLIDKVFLEAVGWRGIRARRAILERTLRALIEQCHSEGRPVRLLDIASGPGRYVLETMQALRHIPISAILRDYKPENLDAASRLRDQLGLPDVSIEYGDAFDRASLAAIQPAPTVAIVSGLYELIPDNERVLRSLQGIADAVAPGGLLIYTAQIWHPQQEFIARVLTNREGQPWIMRCRTQAEMDELVRSAGFTKVSQEVDPWGMFTVSVARRASR